MTAFGFWSYRDINVLGLPMVKKTKSLQLGLSLFQLLVPVFAVSFLVIAFYFRFNAHGIQPGEDRGFRILMLIYFGWLGCKVVPGLAVWSIKQEFMIGALDFSSEKKSLIAEYFFLVMTFVFIVLMAGSILSGNMPKMSRHGSSVVYDSIANPAEFWSNGVAGFFVTIFVSTMHRLTRMQRLMDKQ